MLGNAPLDSLPTPRKLDGTPYANWGARSPRTAAALPAVNTSSNTVFGVAISGELGSTHAGSIPAASTGRPPLDPGRLDPAGSIGTAGSTIGSIAISALDLTSASRRSRRAARRASSPATMRTLDDYIHCAPTGTFNMPERGASTTPCGRCVRPSVTLVASTRYPAGARQQTPMTIGQMSRRCSTGRRLPVGAAQHPRPPGRRRHGPERPLPRRLRPELCPRQGFEGHELLRST